MLINELGTATTIILGLSLGFVGFQFWFSGYNYFSKNSIRNQRFFGHYFGLICSYGSLEFV